MTKDKTNRSQKTNRAGFRLSASRLAAAQALYEMEVAGATPDAVLTSFMEKRWRDLTLHDPDLKPGEGDKARLANPDPAYLKKLVEGVDGNRAEIEQKIDAVLTGEWTAQRLDALMRMIMFTAAYEFIFESGVPKRVIISEYTDLSHAFFDDKEAAFSSGVLSSIAAALRPE